jgi:hypothetical protein
MSLQAIFDPMVKAYFEKKYGGGSGGGENMLDYATSIYGMFSKAIFAEGTDLEVTFGTKVSSTENTLGLGYIANGTIGLKAIKINSPTKFTSGLSLAYAFCVNPVEIIDLSGMVQPIVVTDFSRCFMNCANLREIRGVFDMSKSPSTANAFHGGSSKVEEIRFAQGTIKVSVSIANWGNLSDASIQSIIDGLADLTGGTAQTLTLHPTVGAKLTDAQKTAASTKNWTISY